MEVYIEGPAGRLEGLYWPAAEGSRLAAGALVCHPHPMHGGTLHNSIVFRAARALRACGLSVLRFNFRGVERSQGAHDGQGGEERDAAACLDWLGAQLPDVELWAAGFSFGARTVANLALVDARIARAILIALPVNKFPCTGIERIAQPAYLLFGGKDEFATAADFRRHHPDPPANLEIDEVPQADHYYHGCSPLLEQRVQRYVERALHLRETAQPQP